MKILCRLIGCNWDTDDIHSQLSVVCQTLEPIPLQCHRCGKTAWGRWERGVGVTLVDPPILADQTTLSADTPTPKPHGQEIHPDNP